MRELWDWTGTDAFGATRNYQTYGPDVSQSAMLEHLRGCYPHLTITRLDRATPGQLKPRVGVVENHAFQHGILDEVKKELGLIPPADRKSIVDGLRRQPGSLSLSASHPARPASTLDKYRPVRDRVASILGS